MRDRKKLAKIGVPALIVLLIAGVWFMKNQETAEPVIADDRMAATAGVPAAAGDPDDQPAAIQAAGLDQSAGTAAAPVKANDPNFALHTEKIDLEVLSAYKLPMILDFGSDDCIPCKEMAPVLKSMNAEMQGKAIIRFVDVWKYTDGADGFPVQIIPTQVLVTAEGKPYVPSAAMESSGIRFTMYSTKDTKEHVFTVHQGGLTQEQMRLILKDMGVV